MLDFALNLHRQLPAEGNLVWSPYSVVSALSLVAEGARGRTKDELTAALGEVPSLAEPGGAEVAVANTLWTRAGLPFEDGFQRAVLGLPGGALHSADFAGDPDGARRTINADVAKTTRDLIKDLLAPGTLNRQTAAVIVNALYLKAAWHKAFGTARPAPFHAPGGTRSVPTMTLTERLSYAEADGRQVVTLPTGGDVVMDVITGDGPPPVPLPPARAVRVELHLPKFRVEFGTSLNGPLRALGVRSAFADDADFTGITPAGLAIDSVEHKAVLDVDEQGFEGAAATAVVARLAAFTQPQPPVVVRVDRPFLVVVRHRDNGAVYFMARVTSP